LPRTLRRLPVPNGAHAFVDPAEIVYIGASGPRMGNGPLVRVLALRGGFWLEVSAESDEVLALIANMVETPAHA
jgi:hypothetical protein